MVSKGFEFSLVKTASNARGVKFAENVTFCYILCQIASELRVTTVFFSFFFHSFQLLQKEKPGDHLRFISERQISLPRTYIFFKVTNEQKKSKQELEQGNYPQPYPQRVPFVCCLQIFVRKFVYACYVGETTRHFFHTCT